MKILCSGCKNEIDSKFNLCPYCGFEISKEFKESLKYCSSCGKKIVNGICVNCGKRKTTYSNVNKSEEKKGIGSIKGCFVIIIFTFVILITIGTCSNCGSSSTQNEVNKEVVENSSWDSSVSQVKHYLKNNLKDPDSVQYIEWSNVKKDTTLLNGRATYAVRCKYRAKNSFGGYVISNSLFYLDSNGNVVHVLELE